MLRPLIVAIGFLTRLPVPAVVVDETAFATAIRSYPLVGLIVGAMVAAAGWIGGRGDPWLAALAALVAWVAITGALHLDGLADLADGCGAAHGDRTRLLAVMADPHIGSFGVTALGLQLIAKLVLLHDIAAGGWWPVILIPFAARIAPLAWARWLDPLHPGLGARIASAVRIRDIVGWGAILAGLAVACPALLALPPLAWGYGAWLRRRLGGITGDGHGAGIELIETGLLLALLVARAL